LLHVYSKEGGKPFVAHEVLDLTGKPPCTCERKQFFFLSIGKLSLSENKIYKSGHYDLIKKKNGKPYIDCWNILQSSMIPDGKESGNGGQKLMDTMMI